MTGLIPDEGEVLIANLIFKGGDANRGTSLQLGLMINTSVSETTVLADIVEPTGGTYARKTLADASWSVSGGFCTYALQTFQPVGSAYAQPITGYFIATTGTTPKLLAVEIDANGPYTIDTSNQYDITPKFSLP